MITANVRKLLSTRTGLCAWVINIIKFYEVYCDVEPKRLALAQANTELAQAQEKLAIIKKKVAVSVHNSVHLTIFTILSSVEIFHNERRSVIMT